MIDVAIVGGGAIGAAIAHRLTKEGRVVALFDAFAIGRQASWAGAGILSPIHPWHYPAPLVGLVQASLEAWPEFAREVSTGSGIDLEYTKSGLLMLFGDPRHAAPPAESQSPEFVCDWNRAHGIPVERIDRVELRRLEPEISDRYGEAVLLPEIAQVRNHRIARAAAAAAAKRGARIYPDTPVHSIDLLAGRVRGILTGRGFVEARVVVLAAGAWSSLVRAAGLAGSLPAIEVLPVRGQIVLLDAPERPFRRILLDRDRYLVPRGDGRILVGSTVEPDAGYDPRPTAQAVAELSAAACAIVPRLARASFVEAWAGLRPCAPRGLPYLGPVPGAEGLFVAAGHYRNGIGLAPITAALVSDLVLGRSPSLDLSPFRVS